MLRILHDTKYDFIKHWKTAVGATIAFIVLGLALMGYHEARTGAAVNYSIEFLGGSAIQLKFAQPVHADAVRSAVDAAGFSGSQIAAFGSPTDYLIKVPPKAGATSAPDAARDRAADRRAVREDDSRQPSERAQRRVGRSDALALS